MTVASGSHLAARPVQEQPAAAPPLAAHGGSATIDLLQSLIAAIANELRNPLASAKGHLQLLRREPAQPATAAHLDQAIRDLLRMEAVLDELARHWRLPSWRPRQTSPAELAISWAGSGHDTQIRVQAQEAPALWRLDATRVAHALSCLLSVLEHDAGRREPVVLSVFESRTRLSFRLSTSGAIAAPTEPCRKDPYRALVNGYVVAAYVAELHRGEVLLSDAEGGEIVAELVLGTI